MKLEQVLQLAEVISASSLTEFKYEENGVKISMKKLAEGAPVSMQESVCSAMLSGKTEKRTADLKDIAVSDSFLTGKNADGEESGQVIASPLVGTFYAAPSEEAEPFVKIGDAVKKGQVLAIVEAMKLMNEIECEVSGKVRKIYVKNGETVEYGQPLFLIEENGQ